MACLPTCLCVCLLGEPGLWEVGDCVQVTSVFLGAHTCPVASPHALLSDGPHEECGPIVPRFDF